MLFITFFTFADSAESKGTSLGGGGCSRKANILKKIASQHFHIELNLKSYILLWALFKCLPGCMYSSEKSSIV